MSHLVFLSYFDWQEAEGWSLPMKLKRRTKQVVDIQIFQLLLTKMEANWPELQQAQIWRLWVTAKSEASLQISV